MSNVLVTGANSPLAKVVARHLKFNKHRVIGTTRHSDFRSIVNLYDHVLRVDLSNEASILDIEGSFDAVIHIAAASVGTPKRIMQVTGFATELLIQKAVTLGIKKFIYVSSMSVYGNPSTDLVSATTPVSHTSPFGASKWYGESALFQAKNNMDGFCVRSPAIVGAKFYRHFLGFLLERMQNQAPDVVVSNPSFLFNNIIHELTLGEFLADLSVSSYSGFHAFPVASSDPCMLLEIISYMTSKTQYKGSVAWTSRTVKPFSISTDYASTLGLKPLTTRETLSLWLP